MIYYDEYGNRDNPTIIMLHGAGALDTFSHQYCFSDQYHLIVPHLPGAGKAADIVYEPEKTKSDLYELIFSLHKDKVGVIGHSLGGQIAVMMVSEHPERFCFAVFLSAWVNPRPETIKMYCSLSRVSAKLLHWRWLIRFQGKYWNFTEEQTMYMAEYSKQSTPQVYRSFFANTLDLLSENPNCKTILLPRANHDFPMRNSEYLNKILDEFFQNMHKTGGCCTCYAK